MKVPKCFREYSNDPESISWESVGTAVTTGMMFLFFGGIFILLANYFATTTFTGPCAGSGGVGSYSVDYVQCANGKRVIYERATVESQRYGVRIENGAQK